MCWEDQESLQYDWKEFRVYSVEVVNFKVYGPYMLVKRFGFYTMCCEKPFVE